MSLPSEGIPMIDVEFYVPFAVSPTGAVATLPHDSGIYAPEVYHDDVHDMLIDGILHAESLWWEALTGYTGQYGYRGPVMHASEFVGGRLERDIRATPGVY